KKRSKKEKTIQTHIQTHHAELVQKIEEGEVNEEEIKKTVNYQFQSIQPRSQTHINKIFHLADIHIRNYLRFEEYSIIFDKLYEFIGKEKAQNPQDNNIIVVAGDVFHTKQRLSPEAILQGRDFFKRLSDLYPVFLICGNHDSVIHNKNIKDSLSSVLSHSNFNLHYLKYSGVYRYHNLLFTVSSLLDDGLVNEDVFNKMCEENPVDYQADKGDLKIGLYHGPIASAKNDTGYQMKGNFIIHDFKLNDFTLLGDIHKFQYLDEAQKIAYASSLVSQSFSETDDDHGVLVWDLPSKSSKYQRFYNDYAFKSFIVKDDGYEDHKVLYELEKLVPHSYTSLHFVPKYGRIRLTNECSLYSVFLDKLHKFEKKFPEAEIQVVSNTLSYINDKKIETSLSMNKEQFTIDFEAIMDKYLDENFQGLSEETKEWVINKMDFRNKKNMNNIQWKLLKLDFTHLLGYGKDNTLDFRKYESRNVIGLFAENSCGKSSLLDIITFLLFSKINRNTSNNKEIPKDIIHVNENKAYGSIYFEVSSKIYRVEKQMERDAKGKIKINQYLHRLEPTKSKTTDEPTLVFDKETYELIDLTEEQRQKTDELITGLIGTYNDFIFTAIFLQSGNKNFREMTQKDRKEFLYHILGLNFFKSSFEKEQDEFKTAKLENKTLIEELENLNQEVFEEQMYSTDLEKSDLEEDITDLKEERKTLQDKIKILYSQSPELLEEIRKQPNPQEYATNRINQLKQDFEDNC
ncbi:MAG: AAA family ATPase, partial [Flavobacteriales bacterium]|nr:AAA family ATPase [Flavobacteriales bacterium]